MTIPQLYRLLVLITSGLLTLALAASGASVLVWGVSLGLLIWQGALIGERHPRPLSTTAQLSLYLSVVASFLVSRWFGVPPALALSQMLVLAAVCAPFGTLDRGSGMFILLAQLLGLMMLQISQPDPRALAGAVILGLPLLVMQWSALTLVDSDRRARQERRRLRLPPRTLRVTRALLPVAAKLLIFVMVVAMTSFVLLPRPHSERPGGGGSGELTDRYGVQTFPQALDLRSLSSAGEDGFVASVQLRQGGRVLQSSRPLYWTIASYDRYRGLRWWTEEGHRDFRDADDGAGDGVVTFTRDQRALDNGIEQVIRVAPFNPQLLPVLDEALAVGVGAVRRNAAGGLTAGAPRLDADGRGRSVSFTARSRLIEPQPAPGEKAARGALVGRYLQLESKDWRIEQLAQRLTSRARTDEGRVKAIVRYLESLDYARQFSNPPEGTDPVLHFLFASRRGHCELFAGSMVLMLRTLGIPARVMGGFMGGEWMEFGSYYLIGPNHAHAWVEVKYERTGWVRYDPTPSGDDAEPIAAEDDSDLQDGDMPAEQDAPWSERLLQMNARDRGELLAAGGAIASATALPLLALLAALGLAWWLRRRLLADRAAEAPTEPPSALGGDAAYEAALALLERAGIRRRKGQTSAELLAAVRRQQPAAGVIFARLRAGYLARRFGGAGALGAAPDPALLEQLEAALGPALASTSPETP